MSSYYEESAYKDQLKESLQLAFDTYKDAQKDPNILQLVNLYQCRGCRLVTTNARFVRCHECGNDIPCEWCCRVEQYAKNWVVTSDPFDREDVDKRFCSVECKKKNKKRNKE